MIVRLIGPARVTVPARTWSRLDCRSAGLLAYLAIEGATTRRRMAALLWPEAAPDTARSNLRKCLSRLKRLVRLVSPGELLNLAPGVRVDLEGESGREELLAECEFDECPEFAAWLWIEREHRREAELTARAGEVEALCLQRDLASAVVEAERLVIADPLRLESHHLLIKTLLRMGDRAGALRAAGRMRRFGEEGIGEQRTVRVEDAAGPAVTALPGRRLPDMLRTPPRLIGRDGQLERAERALADYRFVCLLGASGVGKSRLLDELTNRNGPALVHQARRMRGAPPFACLARGLWAILHFVPGGEIAASDREALGPLLPVADGGGGPASGPPFDAHAALPVVFRLFEWAAQRRPLLAIDDFHCWDQASADLVEDVVQHFAGSQRAPRLAATMRPDELPARTRAMIARLASLGLAELVPLTPLTCDHADKLARELAWPGGESLAADAATRSGGNPLLLVENLRLAWEGFAGGTDDLQNALRWRLAGLSGKCRKVLIVIALAGDQFSLDLGAAVLDLDSEKVAAAISEAEDHQLLSGGEFVNAAIAEQALALLDADDRRELNRRIAESVERLGGDEGAVASHRLAAGQYGRALPHLVASARRASRSGATEEAASLFFEVLSLPPEAWAGREWLAVEVEAEAGPARGWNPGAEAAGEG